MTNSRNATSFRAERQKAPTTGTLLTPTTTIVNIILSHDIGTTPHEAQVGLQVQNLLGNYTPAVAPANVYYVLQGVGGYGPGSGLVTFLAGCSGGMSQTPALNGSANSLGRWWLDSFSVNASAVNHMRQCIAPSTNREVRGSYAPNASDSVPSGSWRRSGRNYCRE